MQRIYKYQLEITDDQTIKLKGKPLSVIVQHNSVVLYALYDEKLFDVEGTNYKIHIAGTGHLIDDKIINEYTFLNTVSLYEGDLVFHIFYKGEHNDR